MKHPVFLLILLSLLFCSPVFGLVISEIMYNPPASPGDPSGTSEDLEFVELYNEKAAPEDLSGYKFTHGIHYVFSHDFLANGRPAAALGSGEYLVLAKNAEAFENHYGFAPFGQYYGSLNNSGDKIVLENDAGDPYDPETNTMDRHEGPRIISFSYDDKGDWPAACDGTGFTLSLIDPFEGQGDPKNWTTSPVRWGTPGAANGLQDEWIESTIFPAGSTWRYLKGKAEPPSDWNNRTFNDSSWSNGAAPIGYGENTIVTTLSDMRGSEGYVSFYTRNTFDLSNPGEINNLVLYVNYDDGFVAYLNGTEVARSGLTGTPPDYDETSSSHESGTLEEFDISSYKDNLVSGENVIAIEIHNTSKTSSDAVMDARLVSRHLLSSTTTNSLLRINEVLFNTNPGNRFVEIYNSSSGPVSLSNYYLSSDPNKLDEYQLSGSIPAHGFLAIDENNDLSLELEYQDPPPEPPDIDYGTLRIFLSYIEGGNPDNTYIVNAWNFSGRLQQNYSMATIPDGSGKWFRSSNITREESNELGSNDVNNDIVINEILYNPLKQDDPFTMEDDNLYGKNLEFIELYNKGTSTADLSGWRFSKGVDFIFASGISIGPGKYLVIAENPTRIKEIYGLSNDIVLGPYSGSLDNSSETIRLRNDKNNIIDEVTYYDGGSWDSWANGLGSSLELIDPNQDNNFGGAWKASDDSDKSEWTEISYSGTYSEFSNAPRSDSEFHMYMKGKGELLIDDLKFSNVPSFSTNLLPSGSFNQSSDYTNNWIKSNDKGGTHNQSHWTGDESYSGAGCLKIVATGRGDTGYNRLECDTSQSLSKRTYYVRYHAKWVRGFNLLLTRTCGQGVANMARIPVPDNLGTPGKQNTAYKSNMGPVLRGLNQDPVVPNANQTVKVTVEISDSDGVSGAVIKYRKDTDSSYTEATMNDSGTSGDKEAGDHIWTGTIPGQSSNSVMEFYIEAVDNMSLTTQYPPLPAADAYPNVLKDLAIYRVGDRQTVSNRAMYRITLTRDGLNEFNSRHSLCNNLVPCSFVLNEKKIFYNCGQRFRGSPWIRGSGMGISGGCWNGIRVRFPADNLLFGNVKEINLDASGQTNQHDRTAYYFQRKLVAATPAVYSSWSSGRYADVRYKAGSTQHNNIYDNIQKVNGDYLGYWFPGKNHGPLHKADDWFEYDDSNNKSQNCIGLIYIGPNKEAYRNDYELRDGFEIHEDFSHLLDFFYALQNWSTSHFDNDIGTVMDVPQWSTILCARRFVDDWDSIAGRRGKNAYLYLPSPVLIPEDPDNPDGPLALSQETWKLIPWDSDLTFGNQNVSIYVQDPGLFPNVAKLYSRPWAKRLINANYRYLTTEVTNPTRLSAWLNWVSSSVGIGGTELNNWCQGRANFVRSQIPSDSSVHFRIRSPSDDPYITEEVTATIRGDAPSNVDIITLNGKDITKELKWKNSSATQWEYTAILSQGTNTLDFAGYTRNNYEIDNNELVGSAGIEIISTNERPPSITSISPEKGSTKGGDKITITGSNFQEPLSVRFGSADVQGVEIVSDNEIIITTPPHAAGNVTVMVTSGDFNGTYDSFEYFEINNDFYITVGDASANLNGSFTIPVHLDFDHDPGNTNLGKIQGWSYGICHDPNFITPVEITMGADTKNIKGGNGPDYFSAHLPDEIEGGSTDGITIGVIVDYFQAATIAPINSWYDIDVKYSADCTVCQGLGVAVDTELTPCSNLGNPAIEGMMVINNNTIPLRGYKPGTITINPSQAETFVRSDVNMDGTINLADAISILNYLFGGGQAPDIKDAADCNDDGTINLADAIFTLDFLFGGGRDPYPPFPDPGTDPTPDSL